LPTLAELFMYFKLMFVFLSSTALKGPLYTRGLDFPLQSSGKDWGIVAEKCCGFAEIQCKFTRFYCTIPPSACSADTSLYTREALGCGGQQNDKL